MRGVQSIERAAERGGDDDLEQLIVGIHLLQYRQVVVGNRVGACADLFDERAQFRRSITRDELLSQGAAGGPRARKDSGTGRIAEGSETIQRAPILHGRGGFH